MNRTVLEEISVPSIESLEEYIKRLKAEISYVNKLIRARVELEKASGTAPTSEAESDEG
jgi:hypothetical protein